MLFRSFLNIVVQYNFKRAMPSICYEAPLFVFKLDCINVRRLLLCSKRSISLIWRSDYVAQELLLVAVNNHNLQAAFWCNACRFRWESSCASRRSIIQSTWLSPRSHPHSWLATLWCLSHPRRCPPGLLIVIECYCKCPLFLAGRFWIALSMQRQANTCSYGQWCGTVLRQPLPSMCCYLTRL